MRDQAHTKSMNEWRDFVSSLMYGLIEDYKNGSKDRNLWTESGNMRISANVMGGFKDCPKWEVYVSISVTDHKVRNRIYPS
jgi:hypothetical protein